MAIGTAPDRERCPRCDAVARRAFSPPMLQQVSKPLRTLAEREEQSRDAPAVVSQLPPKRRRPTPAPHPALPRLPRP
jgi:hypothetical protein